MLMLISPAKTLDYESPLPTTRYSQPAYTEQAEALITRLRRESVQSIAELMHLSDKLASLNVARYASWSREHQTENARPAVLAFKGDVYTGLAAENWTEAQFEYAQGHLRILSGLYGLLRPLDLLQPYRLEMGTKLDTDKGQTLYDFWGSLITEALNQECDAGQHDCLINLASNEYFKAVKPKQLKARLISPVFKDQKNGQYKIISFYAKKARGLMSRFLIEQEIDQAQGLLDFNLEGYYYAPELSTAEAPVFLRDHAE